MMDRTTKISALGSSISVLHMFALVMLGSFGFMQPAKAKELPPVQHSNGISEIGDNAEQPFDQRPNIACLQAAAALEIAYGYSSSDPLGTKHNIIVRPLSARESADLLRNISICNKDTEICQLAKNTAIDDGVPPPATMTCTGRGVVDAAASSPRRPLWALILRGPNTLRFISA